MGRVFIALEITIKRIRQLTFSPSRINAPLLISFNVSRRCGRDATSRSNYAGTKGRLWKAPRRRTTIIKRGKVDNNSKSDRRISELWRFSRTHREPGGHYERSPRELGKEKKKTKRQKRRELYGVLRHFSHWRIPVYRAEFRVEYVNSLKWDTRKKMRRKQRATFSILFLAIFCALALGFSSFTVKSATRFHPTQQKPRDEWALLAILSYLDLCQLGKKKVSFECD